MDNIDDIINAAGAGPLAFMALAVLVLGWLSSKWFAGDGVGVRVLIFALMFVGVGLVGYVALTATLPRDAEGKLIDRDDAEKIAPAGDEKTEELRDEVEGEAPAPPLEIEPAVEQSDSSPVARQSVPRKLLLGSCIGRGGVEGVRVWGPPSELCNGLAAWGRYDAQVRPVATLGSCIGRGGVLGVTLYGPVGELCGGMTDGTWGRYASGEDVMAIGISSCTGRGDVIGGHVIWGPHSETCGGFPPWGDYDQGNQRPS